MMKNIILLRESSSLTQQKERHESNQILVKCVRLEDLDEDILRDLVISRKKQSTGII